LALVLFFIIYNLATMIFTGNSNSTFTISDIGEGVMFVYIYALPFYLIVGILTAVIIERINKGIRWVNYSLAGMFVGILIISLNTTNKSIEVIFFYMMAGLVFYLVLKILEFIEQK